MKKSFLITRGGCRFFLVALFLFTTILPSFSQIKKGSRDVPWLMRHVFNKRQGEKMPVLKLYPVLSDSTNFITKDRQGNKVWNTNSPVLRGLFDFDPMDSTHLVIMIDAGLFAQGLDSAGITIGGGGGDPDTDTRLQNPVLDGDTMLIFDLYDVVGSSVIGSVQVDLSALDDTGTADGVTTAGTYNVATDSIDFTVSAPGNNFSVDLAGLVVAVLSTNSITGDGTTGSELQLVNDAASPGNDKFYGTDDGGLKGWNDLPQSYSAITDGSGSAVAEFVNSLFKVRSADALLNITVTDNDPTHGDNILLDVENNLSNYNNDAGFLTAESDDQTVDTFSIISNTLTLAVESDGQLPHTVDLSPYLDNTDAQGFSFTDNTTNVLFDLSGTGSDFTLAEGTNITLDYAGSTVTVNSTASGFFNSFEIYDGTTKQTISDGDSIVFVDSTGINFVVLGADSLTAILNAAIEQLSNVNTADATPTTNQILKYDGDSWEFATDEISGGGGDGVVNGGSLNTGTDVLSLTRTESLPDVTIDLSDLEDTWTISDGTNSETVPDNASTIVFKGENDITVTYNTTEDTLRIDYNDPDNSATNEIQNIFQQVTDGTTPATAETSTDVFKLRSGNGLLDVTTQNDDPTHGDNANLTVEPNLSSYTNDIGFITTEVDGSTTNELQNLTIEGAGPTYTIDLSNGTDVTFSSAGIVSLSEPSANELRITATEVDGSITNEIQDLFGTIQVSGQSDIVADGNNDILTVVAGTNVSITTDAGTDAITINATGDGTGTDDQTVDTFSITSNTLTLAVEDDGQAPHTVDLSPYLDNTDNQNLFQQITDGTTPATAETSTDAFKLRSANSLLSIVTQNDDVTHGDNANFTVEPNLSNYTNDAGFLTSEVDGSTTNELQNLFSQFTDGTTPATADAQTDVFKFRSLNSLLTVATQNDDPTHGDNLGLTVEPNLSNYTNDAGFLTSEVDGSTTNELQDLFQTFRVSGQSDIVADGNNDILTVVAGTNVSITTDAGTDAITINATGTDDQTVDTFSITSNTLTLAVQDDGQPPHTVNLSPYLDNTDNQSLFQQVTDGTTPATAETSTDALKLRSGNSLLSIVTQNDDVTHGDNANFTVEPNLSNYTNDAGFLTDGTLYATKELDNLSGVAINTSLVSDANNTDDLGSDAIEWRDIWTHTIKHGDGTNPNLTITTTSNSGDIIIDPDDKLVVESSDVHLTNTSPAGPSEIRFFEDDAIGSDYVSIRAPTNLTGITSYFWPNDDGTDGQILKTDGAGALSWTDAGGADTYTTIQVDDVGVSTGAPILDFDDSDFELTESPADDFDVTIDDSGIDHDLTTNFIANEHIDHTGVTLTAGAGISGGGDISANRTFDLDFSGSELTLASPESFDDNDRLAVYDASATAMRYMTEQNFESSLTITESQITDLGNYATTALGNLASVAVNADIISDSDNDTDLGSDALEWAEIWTYSLKHDGGASSNMSIENNSTVGDLFLTTTNTPGNTVSILNTDLQIATTGTTEQGVLYFEEDADNGSNTAGIQAPASITTNYVLTLPVDDGNNLDFLQTDGAGVLTWAAGAGGSGWGTDKFTVAADSGTPEDVNENETLTFAGGEALTSVVSATRTITYDLGSAAVGTTTLTSDRYIDQGEIASASEANLDVISIVTTLDDLGGYVYPFRVITNEQVATGATVGGGIKLIKQEAAVDNVTADMAVDEGGLAVNCDAAITLEAAGTGGLGLTTVTNNGDITLDAVGTGDIIIDVNTGDLKLTELPTATVTDFDNYDIPIRNTGSADEVETISFPSFMAYEATEIATSGTHEPDFIGHLFGRQRIDLDDANGNVTIQDDATPITTAAEDGGTIIFFIEGDPTNSHNVIFDSTSGANDPKFITPDGTNLGTVTVPGGTYAIVTCYFDSETLQYICTVNQ